MIPSAIVSAVLVLGAFRLTRLVGWDDFPPVEHVRRLVTGQTVHYNSTEGGEVFRYERPLLSHFLGCPWCVGFWIAIGVYVAWVFEPRWTLYVLAPFALSAAVGLIAKQWDP